MDSHNREQSSEERSSDHVGVVDTIGYAFALLNRRPYLIWMPVALDLVLWSGLRFVLVEPANWINSLPAPAFAGPALDAIRLSLAEFEVMYLSSMLMPTLIDHQSIEVVDLRGSAASSIYGSLGTAIFILGLASAVAIGMTYLTMIGRLVNGAPASGSRFVRDCVSATWRAVAVCGLVASLTAFMFLPFALIGALLAVLGVDPTALLTLAALFLGGWLVICFFFGLPALALGSRSVPEAMRNSYQVVQRNGLAVLGLLVIVILIRSGLPFALNVFLDSEWSVPFAMIVNAYVATGLIAAILLFYKERSTSLATGDANPVAQAS